MFGKNRKARQELFKQIKQAAGGTRTARLSWNIEESREGNDKTVTASTAGFEAVTMVRELLSQYSWPTAPKLSYTGMRRTSVRMDQNDIDSGVITVSGELRTPMGVDVGFDIPVEIRAGRLLEPSIMLVGNSPRVISQSTIDNTVRDNNCYSDTQPRSMYGAPFTREEAAVRKPFHQERRSPGLFAVAGKQASLREFIRTRGMKGGEKIAQFDDEGEGYHHGEDGMPFVIETGGALNWELLDRPEPNAWRYQALGSNPGYEMWVREEGGMFNAYLITLVQAPGADPRLDPTTEEGHEQPVGTAPDADGIVAIIEELGAPGVRSAQMGAQGVYVVWFEDSPRDSGAYEASSPEEAYQKFTAGEESLSAMPDEFWKTQGGIPMPDGSIISGPFVDSYKDSYGPSDFEVGHDGKPRQAQLMPEAEVSEWEMPGSQRVPSQRPPIPLRQHGPGGRSTGVGIVEPTSLTQPKSFLESSPDAASGPQVGPGNCATCGGPVQPSLAGKYAPYWCGPECAAKANAKPRMPKGDEPAPKNVGKPVKNLPKGDESPGKIKSKGSRYRVTEGDIATEDPEKAMNEEYESEREERESKPSTSKSESKPSTSKPSKDAGMFDRFKKKPGELIPMKAHMRAEESKTVLFGNSKNPEPVASNPAMGEDIDDNQPNVEDDLERKQAFMPGQKVSLKKKLSAPTRGGGRVILNSGKKGIVIRDQAGDGYAVYVKFDDGTSALVPGQYL